MPDPIRNCPKCGHPAEFIGRFVSHVATWDCRQPRAICKMGGFSIYVWPEPDGEFTPIDELPDRRLAACVKTADISNPTLALELRREQERRQQ